MPTLTINGKRVKVGDEFLQLSPEDQDAAVDEIAQSLGSEQAPTAQAPSEAYTQARSQMSAMTQNPSRAQFDAMPEWQKAAVAAGDTVQLMGSGATMGFGEKGAAAIRAPFTGKSYAEELAEQQRLTNAAQKRAGGAGTLAEVAGAVAVPVGLAGKGVTLAGRAGTGVMTGAKGLAARSALMGAEGAGYGALTAAGHDQDIGTGAMIGAGAGALGNVAAEGISKGVSKVAGAFNKKPPVPTVAELKSAGSAAFKRADDAGVIFNKQAVDQLKKNIFDDLTDMSFHPKNEPGAEAALTTLRRLSGGNVTMRGLHAVRRMAQNGFIPGKGSNNEAIGKIVSRIDEMIDAADPNTVLTSAKNPKAAAAAFKEAKKQWHTAKKLETVEKLTRKGELMANSNVLADEVGATKKQLRTILTNDGKSRGFNPAEMKQLEKSAGYTPTQRVLHAVSGLMPRDKLSTAVHVAAGGPSAIATGGASLPIQAGLMGVGYTAQKANEALARKSVADLTRLIANGGIPPAQVKNFMQLLSESKREALSRALMAIGVNRRIAGNEAPAQ
jgi:hypothetical protein